MDGKNTIKKNIMKFKLLWLVLLTGLTIKYNNLFSQTFSDGCVIKISNISQPYTVILVSTNIRVETNDEDVAYRMRNTFKMESEYCMNGNYYFIFPISIEPRIVTNIGNHPYHLHRISK